MAERVLVVEDEPDVLDALVQLLAHAGHEARGEADGLAGLRAFQSALGAEPYDLVMLDVMMPKIDGFTLCEAIRSSSDVPVMVLTALDGEDEPHEPGAAQEPDRAVAGAEGAHRLEPRVVPGNAPLEDGADRELPDNGEQKGPHRARAGMLPIRRRRRGPSSQTSTRGPRRESTGTRPRPGPTRACPQAPSRNPARSARPSSPPADKFPA